jgi:NAD(P)-dependent dehydrogenase (short-subunit alcohol dehydrogenase family)
MSKRVLVTGGAQGIGLATAKILAKKGCALVLVDRDAQALAAAAGELGCETHVVDVTDARAVSSLAGTIAPIDVLVNNAGIGRTGALESTPAATFRQLMDVNFWGPVHFIDAFLPSLKARRGTIVNVSSGQAFLKMAGWGAYATTKAALGAYSEILHHELAASGVSVSTIYPFLVKDTRFYDAARPQTLRGRLAFGLTMKLADTPTRVAKRIAAAALDGRRMDRVNPLNDLGYYAQLLPPAATLWGKTVAWLFAEGAPSGFRIDEDMIGDHAFEGSSERQPMRFRATWGTDDLGAWLSAGPTSAPLQLEGKVTVGGLAEDVPMKGSIALRYLEGRIRYEFEFAAAGKRYHYVGEKVNIRPWNLPTSHTTCFGRLTEVETGKLVSSSVTHFRFRDLPQFLLSLRGAEAPPAPAAAQALCAA